MIVDKSQKQIENKPDFEEIKPGITVSKIQDEMINSIASFINHIMNNKKRKKLNEKILTQKFVDNLARKLNKKEMSFCVQKEYQESGSRRSVDIYFYPSEEDENLDSIFSVEVKRLPAPDNKKVREREYVIGNINSNGGIERFKLEEHGKGLKKCGLLAFIEEGDFDYWFKKINEWISELSGTNNWKSTEQLHDLEKSIIWARAFSITHRKNDDLSLFHLWIDIFK